MITPIALLLMATTPDPLYTTIAKLDADLFAAYNDSQPEKLVSFVSNDLEFYHDKTGLAKGKKPFLESYRKNIMGKVRRELVAGTLEVCPLEGYGAVELGVHRFYHPGHDDSEPVGEAKFVMIWHNDKGSWKLTRVISYGHGLAK